MIIVKGKYCDYEGFKNAVEFQSLFLLKKNFKLYRYHARCAGKGAMERFSHFLPLNKIPKFSARQQLRYPTRDLRYNYLFRNIHRHHIRYNFTPSWHTTLERRCMDVGNDVKTLKRHRNNVVLTLCIESFSI